VDFVLVDDMGGSFWVISKNVIYV